MWFWGLRVKMCKMMTSRFATLYCMWLNKKWKWEFQKTEHLGSFRFGVVWLYLSKIITCPELASGNRSSSVLLFLASPTQISSYGHDSSKMCKSSPVRITILSTAHGPSSTWWRRSGSCSSCCVRWISAIQCRWASQHCWYQPSTCICVCVCVCGGGGGGGGGGSCFT